jgi:RNA recognition motif-containing protein
MAEKLYVGNLPFSVTSDNLQALFAQHGEVHSVNIITDRDTGCPRGFGFIEMENAQEAIDALNGHDFEGRALNVNVARERPNRGGGGGRGRR